MQTKTATEKETVKRTGATRRRPYLLALAVGQVVVGGVLVATYLINDDIVPPVIGTLVAGWFWIPLAVANRDRPGVRQTLRRILVAAGIVLAIAIVIPMIALPESGWVIGGVIAIVGIVCLILPLFIAVAMGREPSAAEQAHGLVGGRRTSHEKSAAGLTLHVDPQSDPDAIVVVIEAEDPKYLGTDARLALYALADVHDSCPVNATSEFSHRAFRLESPRTEVKLPRNALSVFPYTGTKVSVKLFAELRLDDGVLRDTVVRREVRLPETQLPSVADDAKELAEPKDLFNLAANLAAIPLHRRLATLLLLLVGAVVIGVNSLVAWHDEFAPESGYYFYARRDSDGDSQSPLFNSLALSGGVGAAVWMAIRRQLRTYTTFRLGTVPDPISRDTVAVARDLVRGTPRVDLHDITVRIVAYNLEKGQYTRGSGSNERTVSFSEPVRAVVLYEKVLSLVRRGQPIEAALEDSFRFEPMFDALHPPSEVSPSHGLFVQWEVQLLHDQFVDHELIPNRCSYRESDFLYAARAEMEAARAG
jgi:hypothetical protein